MLVQYSCEADQLYSLGLRISMGKQFSVTLGLKINMGNTHHQDKLKGIHQQILQTNINVFNMPTSQIWKCPLFTTTGKYASEVLAYALQSSIEAKTSTLKLKSSTTSQNHSWEN